MNKRWIILGATAAILSNAAGSALVFANDGRWDGGPGAFGGGPAPFEEPFGGYEQDGSSWGESSGDDDSCNAYTGEDSSCEASSYDSSEDASSYGETGYDGEESTSCDTEESTSCDTEESESSTEYTGEVLNAVNGVVYGPSGKETYYNLDMSGVIANMRSLGYTGEYWIREDGCKMLGDYIMCAANLSIRPYGTIVESSLGTCMVCDTGEFAASDPYQLDIAVNW